VGELASALSSVGFSSVQMGRTFDPFLGTSKEKTARHFGVQGVNVLAFRNGTRGPASSD
jgi:hypothetical protein